MAGLAECIVDDTRSDHTQLKQYKQWSFVTVRGRSSKTIVSKVNKSSSSEDEDSLVRENITECYTGQYGEEVMSSTNSTTSTIPRVMSLQELLEKKEKTIENLKTQIRNQKLQLSFYLHRSLHDTSVIEHAEHVNEDEAEESDQVNLAMTKFNMMFGRKSRMLKLHERVLRADTKIATLIKKQEALLRKVTKEILNVCNSPAPCFAKRELRFSGFVSYSAQMDMFSRLLSATLLVKQELQKLQQNAKKLIILEEERNSIADHVLSLPPKERINSDYLMAVEREKVMLGSQMNEIKKEHHLLKNRIEQLRRRSEMSNQQNDNSQYNNDDSNSDINANDKTSYYNDIGNHLNKMLELIESEAISLATMTEDKKTEINELMKIKGENTELYEKLKSFQEIAQQRDELEVKLAEMQKTMTEMTEEKYFAYENELTKIKDENSNLVDKLKYYQHIEREKDELETKLALLEQKLEEPNLEKIAELQTLQKRVEESETVRAERDFFKVQVEELEGVKQAYSDFLKQYCKYKLEFEKTHIERDQAIEQERATMKHEFENLTSVLCQQDSQIRTLLVIINRLGDYYSNCENSGPNVLKANIDMSELFAIRPDSRRSDASSLPTYMPQSPTTTQRSNEKSTSKSNESSDQPGSRESTLNKSTDVNNLSEKSNESCSDNLKSNETFADKDVITPKSSDTKKSDTPSSSRNSKVSIRKSDTNSVKANVKPHCCLSKSSDRGSSIKIRSRTFSNNESMKSHPSDNCVLNSSAHDNVDKSKSDKSLDPNQTTSFVNSDKFYNSPVNEYDHQSLEYDDFTEDNMKHDSETIESYPDTKDFVKKLLRTCTFSNDFLDLVFGTHETKAIDKILDTEENVVKTFINKYRLTDQFNEQWSCVEKNSRDGSVSTTNEADQMLNGNDYLFASGGSKRGSTPRSSLFLKRLRNSRLPIPVKYAIAGARPARGFKANTVTVVTAAVSTSPHRMTTPPRKQRFTTSRGSLIKRFFENSSTQDTTKKTDAGRKSLVNAAGKTSTTERSTDLRSTEETIISDSDYRTISKSVFSLSQTSLDKIGERSEKKGSSVEVFAKKFQDGCDSKKTIQDNEETKNNENSYQTESEEKFGSSSAVEKDVQNNKEKNEKSDDKHLQRHTLLDQKARDRLWQQFEMIRLDLERTIAQNGGYNVIFTNLKNIYETYFGEYSLYNNYGHYQNFDVSSL